MPKLIDDLDNDEIPIVSFKNYLAGTPGGLEQASNDVERALSNHSAFYLVDHGMNWSIAENMIRDMYAFFALPLDFKIKYCSTKKEDGRGYVPYATHNVHAFMGRHGLPCDAMERFMFGPLERPKVQYEQDSIYVENFAPNIYSSEPMTFRQSTTEYNKAIHEVCEHVLRVFSVAMGQATDYLENRCNVASKMLKINHYPIVTNCEPEQYRIAPHTDFTPITILLVDDPCCSLVGLNSTGRWTHIKPPHGALVIIGGDCTARMTNDRWPALLHKVGFPRSMTELKSRLSCQFFVQMNPKTRIETVPKFLNEDGTSKFEAVTYEDLMGMKMKDLINDDLKY